MDVITISREKLNYYFSPNERNNILFRSEDFMDRYSKTGETAFRMFGLAIERDANLQFAMCATRDPLEQGDARHYITALLPLRFPGGNEPSLLPVMLQLTKTKEGPAIDIDIPAADPLWEKHGVSSFKDIPKVLAGCLVDISIPLIGIFSEIQRKAFNTRSKIEKLRKKAEKEGQKNPPEQSEKKQTVKRVIKLSGDITYSIVADTEQHRQYRRYCGAWEVRGHYRHYKTGKVSYVKPHVKGQGKLKTKTYSLEGETI